MLQKYSNLTHQNCVLRRDRGATERLNKHDITLYGFSTTRSSRCKWTLQELGLPFEDVDDPSLVGTDTLRELHPQGKLPVCVIDGEALFESSAICTCLCDLVPDKQLIASVGTRDRALHYQWVSFALTEMENYLWHSFRHTEFYPESRRVPEVVASNSDEFRAGAKVLNDALKGSQYLVGKEFSVTDIIVSWLLNWGRRLGLLDEFSNLHNYLKRLFEREHCTLRQD